jgi:iron complex transport system substrate-binding protein
LQVCALAFSAVALLAGCQARVQPAPSADPRVVSLAPSMTEIVCAVGGRDALVGRSSACDYPPEVAKVPIVGGFGAPSLELLVAARPSLILDIDLADETIGRKIDALGLKRERVRCRSLDDIPAAMLRVGTLLSHADKAQALADELKRQVALLRTEAGTVTNRPSVYVEIWNDPLTTVGRGTFLSELIQLAGGRNVGDEVNKDYFEVSPEWIVSRDPDVILCFYMKPGSGVRERVLERPGWKQVKAVQSRAVYDGFDNNLILRPGPRVLDGIKALRACIRRGAER